MKPKKHRLIFLTFCVFFALPVLMGHGQEDQKKAASSNAAKPNGIVLNFRGVPLDTVLDYLSQAAGFIIVKETDLDGQNVDVWSHQPLTKDEAVNLLNTILYEKGFAAIRNDRTLTIVNRDNAKQRDIPVKSGNNPELIPKTDEMITQIVPVRSANAVQLIENLQPLLPTYANLSANESSNAIIVTDTQKNIRRIVEIIQKLDSSISSISTVAVFQLQYADAQEIAEVVEEIFQVEESSGNQRRGGMPFPPFMGGGRGGRGDRGGDNQQESEARTAASRVVAVADERTNSLVVTAPEELMPLIEKLVSEIDTMTEDITEICVFTLQFADAVETADILTELFPDESSSNQNQFAPRFGRGGPPMPGMQTQNQNQNQNQSQRQLQQTTVRAVADPRTNSIVVTAASETMIQIRQMIEQLDSRSDRKQKVFVYRLEYADVENVTTILRNIFEGQTNNTINRANDNTATNTLSGRTVNVNPDNNN
ncbi:MAG: hypothetical protein JXR73_08000 [Candidatus Omnitrophica bacterium]|nr:hypothetical protein [Candidatus Omnitrophota bacterium]